MVVGADDDPVPALGLLCSRLSAARRRGSPSSPGSSTSRALRVPVLFVSGTRDSLAGRAALTERAAKAIPGKVTFHWLETADHGYRPLKASGRTTDDVLAEVADTSVGLGGGVCPS